MLIIVSSPMQMIVKNFKSNDCANYGKQSFISCYTIVQFVLNDENNVSNLNDHVGHGKRSFRSCQNDIQKILIFSNYEKDKVVSQNLAENEIRDLIKRINRLKMKERKS